MFKAERISDGLLVAVKRVRKEGLDPIDKEALFLEAEVLKQVQC